MSRRRTNIIVPIVSMGDIAFLLIIFFILTSTFMDDSSRAITLPVSPDIAAIEDSMISVAIDADGAIYVQGVQVYDAKAVEAALEALLEGLEGQQRIVLLRCDADVDKQIFEPVVDAIASTGATIAALGEQQK